MNPLAAALDLIKRWEGCPDGDPATVNLDPYLDPVGIWTIGWGHAIRDAAGYYVRGLLGRDLARSLYPGGITQPQADRLLRDDVRQVVFGLRPIILVPLAAYQWAALISFTFNEGLSALVKSTLLRDVNTSQFAAAAGEFGRWIWAGGRVLPGLVARRAAEAATFRG